MTLSKAVGLSVLTMGAPGVIAIGYWPIQAFGALCCFCLITLLFWGIGRT